MTDCKGIGAFYLPGLVPVGEWPAINVGHEGACGWRRYVPERTCRDVSEEPWQFWCSECGARLDLEDNDGKPPLWWNPDGSPLPVGYCPNCGARVVEG